VKCRSHSSAVYNNEFILSSACVGSKITETICYSLYSILIVYILRSCVNELKWCINSDWAGSQIIERAVGESRLYIHLYIHPLAFVLEEDIFSRSNNKMMWCNKYDFLRDNDCYSCLSLFGESFLGRHMQHPVWIHCCKRPNYDLWISQGSVATVLWWGELNYSHLGLCQISSWCCLPKISKIG